MPRSKGAYPKVLWRDQLAHWLCEKVLRYVASAEYEAFIWANSRAGSTHLMEWTKKGTRDGKQEFP